MVYKKRNFIDIIIDIIIILLTVLIVYWFIKLIFGGSPGLDEFNFALILLMAGILFKIYREIGEVKAGIKHGFIKIPDDINLIRNDTDLIKNYMASIKQKLKI